MHFCSECDNMYYIRVSAEDGSKLIYYCRNCGHEDQSVSSENICVSKTNFKKSELSYNHLINEYTKLDPTLPRINTIKCPNSDCSSNHGSSASAEAEGMEGEGAGDKEVIFLRYDDSNMLYVYLCAKCDTVWKTDQIN